MQQDNYISIQEPVAAAKTQLGISHSTEDPYLQMKGFEAERKIASAYTIVKKQDTIPIVDFQAEMPKGFHSLVLLRLTGDTSCEYPSYVPKSFYKSDPNCPNTYESYFAPNFDFKDGVIYFSTDITATECDVAYNGFNLDEDGWPLIHESHDLAIQKYICAEYTMKYFDQYPENVRAMYGAQWRKYCMQARSASKMPDPSERRYLTMLWNNMLRPYNHLF